MPKFMIEGSYSTQGSQGLIKEGGSGRKAALEQAVASVGGKVESLYFAFGDTDVVLIVDVPDSASVVAASVTASAAGGVSNVKTTPFITVEEMDAAMKKSPAYKAPGA
jgi:uncharacterized protein with GYD domain